MIVSTITPVPPHKHDDIYCEGCSKHKALERTLFLAACLMYTSNTVDGEVALHSNAVYKMAKAAWEGLGCPSEEVVEQICRGVDGWDGCQNHGFDWWRNAN